MKPYRALRRGSHFEPQMTTLFESSGSIFTSYQLCHPFAMVTRCSTCCACAETPNTTNTRLTRRKLPARDTRLLGTFTDVLSSQQWSLLLERQSQRDLQGARSSLL